MTTRARLKVKHKWQPETETHILTQDLLSPLLLFKPGVNIDKVVETGEEANLTLSRVVRGRSATYIII